MGSLITIQSPKSLPVVPDLNAPIDIRPGRMQDIPGLLTLINDYAAKGIMLPRTEFEMAENIRDFVVAYSGQHLVACGGLHFYSPTVAEVRSLAVHPDWKNHHLGSGIVKALEQEALSHKLHSLFAFTYVEGFFRKMGYNVVDRGELPLKAWKDCLRCPKFQACDEIAMVKLLPS